MVASLGIQNNSGSLGPSGAPNLLGSSLIMSWNGQVNAPSTIYPNPGPIIQNIGNGLGSPFNAGILQGSQMSNSTSTPLERNANAYHHLLIAWETGGLHPLPPEYREKLKKFEMKQSRKPFDEKLKQLFEKEKVKKLPQLYPFCSGVLKTISIGNRKPNTCPVYTCGKAFNNAKALKSHISTTHKSLVTPSLDPNYNRARPQAERNWVGGSAGQRDSEIQR